MSDDPNRMLSEESLDRQLRSQYSELVGHDWQISVERRLWPRISTSRHRPSRLRLFSRPVVAAAAVLLVSASIAFAVSNLVDLGKPTATLATNPHFPLSGFHRITTRLGSPHNPEVLFIGTQLALTGIEDHRSAAERWPLVKALNQFGSWSGIAAAIPNCGVDPGLKANVCSDPTYDWLHARYRSKYIQFVHKDLLTSDGLPLQRLSPAELGLYNRYARRSGGYRTGIYRDPYNAAWTVEVSGSDPRHLPLVLIGDYLQTVSQLLGAGDFEQGVDAPPPTVQGGVQTVGVTGLPFDTVRRALATGRSPHAAEFLVSDVNAEANIMTALMCHADGRKPSNVCNRPTIKQILKQVK